MNLLNMIRNLPTRHELVGSFGEQLVALYSKLLPGALILRDVLIDGADQYHSQIDLLIIGNRGIYVVEVKTYTDAKIYGDAEKSKWHYYIHGKKYEIYSPLRQNQKHIEYLKTFLKDFGNIPCFSVITLLCDDFKVSGNLAPNTVICNSLPSMKHSIIHLAENNPQAWDDTQKEAICAYIQNHQHQGKTARTNHKEAVVAYKNQLEEMKQQRKCPYCKTDLVLRKGKYGEFYGCPNYPKCSFTAK